MIGHYQVTTASDITFILEMKSALAVRLIIGSGSTVKHVAAFLPSSTLTHSGEILFVARRLLYGSVIATLGVDTFRGKE